MKQRMYYYYLGCIIGGLNIGCALRSSWDHSALWLIAFNTIVGVYVLILAGRKLW